MENASFETEVSEGQRFEFGRNWAIFLDALNDDRIAEAEKSLREMLDVDDLQGKSFLDIGSGSGLFSLAASRLGAKVHSFDYDPQSVACTEELRKRYPSDDWVVESGSALDPEYLNALGQFDVVYSWGVLHHTGNMWQALENVVPLVAGGGGQLFIAIYNDIGYRSPLWKKIKALYNRGMVWRWGVKLMMYPKFFIRSVLSGLLKHRDPTWLFVNYKKSRGMSIVSDWRDWLGGYPYEYARPEAIFRFYRDRGFALQNMKAAYGLDCNEFVFVKNSSSLAESGKNHAN